MIKILLLDLDGTIRETISGQTFISDPNDQRAIEGSIEAMEIYHADGWGIIGITNQGGVAAGHKSLESAIEEQKKTLELFPQLAYIYFCPDFKGELCYRVTRDGHAAPIHEAYREFSGRFRKPNPGMIRVALGDSGAKALMVGDRPEDEEAATNAGIDFMLAEHWRFSPE